MPAITSLSTPNPAKSRSNIRSTPLRRGLRAQPGNPMTARLRNQPRHRRLPGSTGIPTRSEEHTSELQSLMRISYAVFCLKKKKNNKKNTTNKRQQNNQVTNTHTPQYEG